MAQTIDAPDAKTPKVGHNSAKPPLSREDRAALLNHHIDKLREQEAAVTLARAPFDAAQQALTSRFNAAKSDLGKAYSRKYLKSLLEDVGARIRNIAQSEEQRFQDRVALGLPVFGVQQDLFGGKAEAMPQEARDEYEWQADGFLAGRRCDERKAPEGCPPRMDQFWLKGYDLGQTEAAAQFTKGAKVAQDLAGPPPKPAKPAKPKEAPEPADTEAAIRKSVRKVKDSDFMATDKKAAA